MCFRFEFWDTPLDPFWRYHSLLVFQRVLGCALFSRLFGRPVVVTSTPPWFRPTPDLGTQVPSAGVPGTIRLGVGRDPLGSPDPRVGSRTSMGPCPRVTSFLACPDAGDEPGQSLCVQCLSLRTPCCERVSGFVSLVLCTPGRGARPLLLCDAPASVISPPQPETHPLLPTKIRPVYPFTLCRPSHPPPVPPTLYSVSSAKEGPRMLERLTLFFLRPRGRWSSVARTTVVGAPVLGTPGYRRRTGSPTTAGVPSEPRLLCDWKATPCPTAAGTRTSPPNAEGPRGRGRRRRRGG